MNSKIDIASVRKGIVCFTYDDARYPEWLDQLPLFDDFHAHATFFYSGPIDADALKSMRILREHGHSVGLHTLSHANTLPFFEERGADAYFEEQIRPQLDVCRAEGFVVDLLAYPNNLRSSETDRALAPYFRHFRAGIPGIHPKGYRIADQDEAFLPLEKIASTPALGGCGIGEYYLTAQENLDSAMERVARENKLLVFFSHGIHTPPFKPIDMSRETLRASLATAAHLGILCAGFDELP